MRLHDAPPAELPTRVILARDILGVTLAGRAAGRLDELTEHPSVAAEVEVVRSL